MVEEFVEEVGEWDWGDVYYCEEYFDFKDGVVCYYKVEWEESLCY